MLKKSSSVAEEAVSALEQSVPEGALPDSRRTMPSSNRKESTCLAESAGPVSTSSVPRVEVALPPSPMGERGKTADSTVMEVST